MPKPLDERIAAALSPDARAVTVADLIGEVAGLIAATIRERDDNDALSKAIDAPEAEADIAADAVIKLDRKVARLTAKREQLEARHVELMNTERRKRAEADHADITARRDQLAADIREHWPRIVGEMIDLLQRIEKNDAEIAAFQQGGVPAGLAWLQSAESLAREVPANWYHNNGVSPIARFTKIKIPTFDGRDTAWPDTRPERERIAQREEGDRQRLVAAQRQRQAQLARFQRYEIEPARGTSPLVGTIGGKVNIVRRGEVQMSIEQVDDARAKGCRVEPLADGKRIGFPVMGTL